MAATQRPTNEDRGSDAAEALVQDEQSRVVSTLREHPRLMGAVFHAVLLLSAAGSAAAANGSTLNGP